MIAIEKAYSNAYDDAQKDDIQLNEKRKTIEQQLVHVKNKMNKVKENAKNIQATITDILEKTLVEMHEFV